MTTPTDQRSSSGAVGVAVLDAPFRRAVEAAGRAQCAGIDERDLMPDVSDLPESLSDAEVEKRFGGIGGARYGAMLAEIDARIAALPLLRR